MTRSARWATALVLSFSSLATAAEFRTTNFKVSARTPEIARRVGEAAEVYRKELALEWTGQVMPNWVKPCPIKVTDGNIGAGGSTTFTFDRGEVFGWRMNVQGTVERILDSVLPHEVSHTVFACYFRRPLPRWADEGAATLVEHDSERARQTKLLNQVIRTSKRIPLTKLLSMTEYPERMQDVLTLYAEGYALADLLVQKGGKAKYLKVLQTAHEQGWELALQKHYGYRSIKELESEWTGWVIAGSPPINTDTLVASNTPVGARGQSPAASRERNDRTVSVPSVGGLKRDRRANPRPRSQSYDRELASASPAPRRLPQTRGKMSRDGLRQPVLVRTASGPTETSLVQ